MTPLTRAKVTVAVIGAICFGAGIRLELAAARWAGLALLVIALLLRFGKRREREADAE